MQWMRSPNHRRPIRECRIIKIRTFFRVDFIADIHARRQTIDEPINVARKEKNANRFIGTINKSLSKFMCAVCRVRDCNAGPLSAMRIASPRLLPPTSTYARRYREFMFYMIQFELERTNSLCEFAPEPWNRGK